MNPSGLCKCGCGQPTAISRDTWVARGYVKGQPRDYIRGHNARVDPVFALGRQSRHAKMRAAKKHGPPRAGQTLKAKAIAKRVVVTKKGRWW